MSDSEKEKKLREAIGQVVLAFSKLESAIDRSIWIMISDEERIGQIVTGNLNFSLKIDLLFSLIRHYDHEVDDIRMKKLRTTLDKCREDRNGIMHSLFTPSGRQISYSARAKKGLRFNYSEVEIEKVEVIVEMIKNAEKKLLNFIVVSDFRDKLFPRLLAHFF
jgi:hypothetical protein